MLSEVSTTWSFAMLEGRAIRLPVYLIGSVARWLKTPGIVHGYGNLADDASRGACDDRALFTAVVANALRRLQRLCWSP
jgi:hypothetical protein